MCELIKMPEVSRILGIREPQIRNLMRRGILPIGTVLSPKMTGKKTWTYYVYKSKLNHYLEIENAGQE